VAVFGMTGERASMSNGSLASSRILNMARSPNAIVYVCLKFSTVAPYTTIQMFERILRDFVQARPREWANFAGFRATRVVADLGYIGRVPIWEQVDYMNWIICPELTLTFHSLRLVLFNRVCGTFNSS
jgi:hypothetical protein